MIKRKHIFGTLLAIGLALFIIILTGIAVLRSQAFHRYILTVMIEKASQATGGRVEIGSFQFRWSGLRVDLNHLVLHGDEAPSRPPLLQVDHLMVGVKIISLWRGKIDLNEIVIDRPSINISVDPKGSTNLPHAPPSAPGSPPTNIFDLAIRHFVVNQGEVDYNDRHLPLDGDVHDLFAQVSFDSFKTEYRGLVGYRDGRVQFGNYGVVQHSIEARFGATPARLTLDSLELHAGLSSLSAQAQLDDYSNPVVHGSYQAALSTGELGDILKTTSLPVGQIALHGTVDYVTRVDQPLLDTLTLAGQFQSQALALNLPQVHTRVRALTGEYRLSGGTLEARNVRADALGGRLSADLSLAHLSDRPLGRITAAVRDVSLEAVSAATGTSQLRRAAITGKLNGTMEGSWEGSGDHLQIRSDATIAASAPVEHAAGPAGPAIPLQGALHLTYDGPSGVISLRHTEFTTPHTTVDLDGSTGKQSSLNIQARSDDLREVDQLVLIARQAGGGANPSSPGRPSSPTPIEPLSISGAGSFTGQLRGSLPSLHLTGHVSGSNLQYQGTVLSELQVNLALSPSDVTLSQGEMQTPDRGQVKFDVETGLANWTYTPQSPVRLDITAAQISVASLERIGNIHYPITGTLGARISAHGSQSNLTGQGSATLAKATAWNQPIQNLSVQFQGAGTALSAALQVQTPAGSGSGKLSYDFHSQAYEAQFNVPDLHVEKLQAANQGKLQASGVVSASLEGRGTLKDPQLTGAIQAPKLIIEQQTLEGLKVQGSVAQQKANLTLATVTQGISLQARANVDLTGNYNATASFDVPSVQVGALLTTLLPQAPSGLHGQAEVHGSLQGPLKQRDQLEAEVNIPTLNLAYQSLQIGNASPIRAVYRGGVVSLESCTLKGTGTDLQLQGSVPLEHSQNLHAKATGNIDLHLVQLLYPDWSTSGQVRLDVGADGALPHPNVHGTVRVVDGVIEPPGVPLGAEKLNAALAIQNNRADIQSFTGQAGGGTVTATGFATLRPALQFDVRLSAKEVRLRYPAGTRTILESTLNLTGSPEAALLSGQVLIDRLSLTKGFNLSTFADQFSESSSVSPGQGFAQNLKLSVSVTSASDMAVANSQLSLQGSVNLRVQGTAAQPVILGRTDITDGELFFNAQRYKIENGVISFVNPVQTEPVVNLHVTATINQFDISMNVVGPLDRLRTTYSSDPPLAPVDIINLIATGQTTEAASTSPTTPQSVIAGQLTSQFSNRVQKLAGISSLTIDPQVGGAQGNGIARVGVQERVTKNLYFAFSTDLTNSAAQTVQVEYQLTRRFAVSTMRDQNGIYTLQIKMHKRF